MRSRVGMLGAGLALAALLPVSAARGQASCADCCYYSCLAANLQETAGMRDMYQGLVSRKGLTEDQYASAVAEARQRLAVQEAGEVGGIHACDWHFPDPTDSVAMRQWQSLRWGLERLPDGRVAWKFSIQTDMETCKLRDDQLARLRQIAPCGGFADATEAHERRHVDQCNGRGAGKEGLAQPHGPGRGRGLQRRHRQARGAARGGASGVPQGVVRRTGRDQAADRLRAALPILKVKLGKKR